MVIVLGFSTGANAAIRWVGDFSTNNLMQWATIQCGGQNSSCPCLRNYFCPQPPPTVPHQAGSCSTLSTDTPPTPPDGRFQVVSAPGQPLVNALRVELRFGDYWPHCSTSPLTVRNELVYAKEDGINPTTYRENDDRTFVFSVFYPSANWTSFTCDSGTPGPFGQCPWNVNMQLHSTSDPGTTTGAQLELGPVKIPNTTQYALAMQVRDDDLGVGSILWHDVGPNSPMRLDTWYDFALRVKFASTRANGIIELWTGLNGGPKTKQTLNCPPPDAPSDRCLFNVITPGNPGSILKAGHYRHAGINDTTVVYHKGWVVGDSPADFGLF